MDVMLDLETLGTSPGSVILSIGACTFDGQQVFSAHLELDEQVRAGATIDPSTVLWWMGQSNAARDKIRGAHAIAIPVALRTFSQFYTRVGGQRVWGNGSSFDMPLLEALYRRFGMPLPWDFRAHRDVRTIFDLAGKKVGDYGTANVLAHDALADALYQAAETVLCMADLRERTRKAQEADKAALMPDGADGQ